MCGSLIVNGSRVRVRALVQQPSRGDSTRWPFGTNQVAQTCSDLTHITGVPLKYVCHSGWNYIITPVIQY
jgi:hypothetical protein